MRYVLDTNALIQLLRTAVSEISRKVDLYHPGEIGIPVVALYELYVGAYRSARVEENLAKIRLLHFPVVPLEPKDVREAAEIRTVLEFAGVTIGPNDLLIAGQARARGLVLVTHNVREFARVAGLAVEDWQATL